ncbi:MAG TPA: hypothetical protein EYQ00_00335, partial [Dehalococcoidia bacterium]|nr:hypothetical protein [Dehalococcoidia bacterium]
MPVRFAFSSHTPLKEYCEVPVPVSDAVKSAHLSLQEWVSDYDPELVIALGPDHFNGFFYNIMPPFCIGVTSEAVGDWNTPRGEIRSSEEVALNLLSFAHEHGVDVASSYNMKVDHGISHESQQDYLRLSREFFQLSVQQKQSVDMIHSPHFRGYNAMGSEMTAGRLDAREQFDWMNEEQAIPDSALSQPWQKLIGPNLWPTSMPGLKPSLTKLQDQLSDITVNLLQRLCASLGVEAHALDHTIGKQPYTHAKLIRYPGQHRPQQGVGAHKDPGY